MALKRFTDNAQTPEKKRVAIPLTSSADNTDYYATGSDMAEIVLNNTSRLWDLKATVLPTCRSFRDPEYLKAGAWFFEDISNTEDKPDKLKEKNVQFARLLCEEGQSAQEGLKFVKQYLFYVNMTDNELELSMRGLLLNGGGEVQGATPWKTGVDEADVAKEAINAKNADIATSANSAKKISYTKIEVETSINNMKTIGSYRCSYPKTDLLTDVPDFLKTSDFYKIDIIDKGIGNRDILQIVTTPSCIGIRATGNNATRWYNWYEMATTNKIFGDFKDFTGNDLNDFNIKGGSYRVLKTVSNEPFNKNYNLTIERYDGGNAQFQIAKHIFSGKIKIRSYSANGWTAWQELTTNPQTQLQAYNQGITKEI